VRLGGCDLRCAWCDSPGTWLPAETARIESEPGSARFRSLPNPVDLKALLEALDALGADRHQFVSLTGGEPLLQPEVVAALSSALSERGASVYLETHGLATEAIEPLAPQIDVVSMDWKLASDVRRASDPRSAPVADFHEQHQRFLRAARRAREVFVKVVLTPATGDGELDEVCRRIEAVAPDTILVLQPVTPFGRVREAPDAERLLAWTRRCAERLPEVRLIPQTHRSTGVL
jgi:organic radical activating enzyme